MAASITVDFTRTQLTPLGDLCWQLVCTATAATDMPLEIFVMHRVPDAAGESNYTDTFEAIADAQDLDRIPATNPDLTDEMPYYRVASIALLFKDALTLEDIRAQLKDIIQNTVDELNAVTGAASTETETFS